MKEVVFILRNKVCRVEYYWYEYHDSDMPRLNIEMDGLKIDALKETYQSSNDRIKVSFEIDEYFLTYDCVISHMSETSYLVGPLTCNIQFIVFGQSIQMKPCQFCKTLHMHGDSPIAQIGELIL